MPAFPVSPHGPAGCALSGCGSARPGGVEDAGSGGLEPLVVVGDQQLDAAEPAAGQRAQERGPEGLGLVVADRHAEHLAPAQGYEDLIDHDTLPHDLVLAGKLAAKLRGCAPLIGKPPTPR